MHVHLRAAAAALAAFALAACTTNASQSSDAPGQGPAEVQFVIASAAEGAAVFSAHDDYIDVLSPADISLRTRGAPGASAEDVAQLYASATAEWTPDERRRLGEIVRRRRAVLDQLAAWLPDTVLLVKATGDLESGIPHTRGNAISMGARLRDDDARVESLFFHELFHVLSRTSAARHDELYGVIGFERCELVAPASLAERMLSNPDAPRVQHAAPIAGGDLYVTPVLVAEPSRYDPGHPNLGEYFQVQLFALRRGADGNCRIAEDAGLSEAQLREALFARAGRNTDYIFHPEEVMADNFAQMMMGERVVNPEVHERLATLLGVTRPRAQR